MPLETPPVSTGCLWRDGDLDGRRARHPEAHCLHGRWPARLLARGLRAISLLWGLAVGWRRSRRLHRSLRGLADSRCGGRRLCPDLDRQRLLLALRALLLLDTRHIQLRDRVQQGTQLGTQLGLQPGPQLGPQLGAQLGAWFGRRLLLMRRILASRCRLLRLNVSDKHRDSVNLCGQVAVPDPHPAVTHVPTLKDCAPVCPGVPLAVRLLARAKSEARRVHLGKAIADEEIVQHLWYEHLYAVHLSGKVTVTHLDPTVTRV
mmetsp:Transcript_98488/g.306392  ORF Transcript_98488/g.306392 Transcript_98488/m.306392 type:complete len:261 (+) Transcript_98488:1129-1911(+)